MIRINLLAVEKPVAKSGASFSFNIGEKAARLASRLGVSSPAAATSAWDYSR